MAKGRPGTAGRGKLLDVVHRRVDSMWHKAMALRGIGRHEEAAALDERGRRLYQHFDLGKTVLPQREQEGQPRE